MSYQVLARKWRPRTFQTLIGQEHVLRMLTNALELKRLHHAYLFTGTRGVGKTTIARILAKCLNCESGITAQPCETCAICTAIDAGRFLDLIEVDAASRTKVEDTRELLDNIHYQPALGRYKIYLIDEVHMLSTHSFNALLKTLEEPPPYVIFLLATTDPKRLPITVLSRCLQFNLKRVPAEQISTYLEHICGAENLPYEKNALTLLAQAADGSLRDALSLLDQTISYCGAKITTTDTRQMLGSIEQDALLRLLNALADQDGKQLLNEINRLAEHAPDFHQALEDILSILHQISVTQIVAGSPEQRAEINALAARLTAEEVQLFYQIALIGRRDLAHTPYPQQGFEMILMRMLAFKPVTESASAKPITESAPLQPKQTTPVPVQKSTPPAASPTQPSKLAPPQQDTSQWTDMLSKLGLTGMAYALASNCTLTRYQDNQVSLAISAAHAPMLNKKLQERVQQALTLYLKQPIKLDIQIAAAELHTPAKQHAETQAAKQANATTSIKNDEQLQTIVDMFNATLDLNSIQAVETSS